MEDFKRPDHPDFYTSAELSGMGWSGIRHNSLTDEQELWMSGEVKLRMPTAVIAVNPDAWDKAYADIFGFYSVQSVGKGGH